MMIDFYRKDLYRMSKKELRVFYKAYVGTKRYKTFAQFKRALKADRRADLKRIWG